MKFWSALLRVIDKLLDRYSEWQRRQKQQDDQEQRDAIDRDSAQYVADKYGDGRVRKHKPDADKADSSEHP